MVFPQSTLSEETGRPPMNGPPAGTLAKSRPARGRAKDIFALTDADEALAMVGRP